MSVVSNSSPLINLARIGRLGLLSRLYDQLTIPEAVWHEVVVQGTGQAGAYEIEQASWIQVQPVTNRALVRALRYELDAGEAQAIELVLKIDAEFVLMDEHLGRETASHMGIRSIGVIGALVEAKRKGVIDCVHPLLDALRDLAGFWISETLYQRVLQDQGESA